MINEENGFNEDSTQEISTATTQAAGEIQNLIGPAIQQTVSQYHGLLRQGLEREVQRIVQEFEAATADIESSITKRIKSRMMDLVNDEVRRVFDDALSSAESALIGPARNLEIISRRPPISQVPQERAPQPPIEQAPIEHVPLEHAPSRETHSPDNPDDDDDGGGGSRVNAFWPSADVLYVSCVKLVPVRGNQKCSETSSNNAASQIHSDRRRDELRIGFPTCAHGAQK